MAQNNIDWSNATDIKVAKVDNLRNDNTFVATDGETYWKDTYPGGAVDAAYDGEDKYDQAEVIDEPDDLEMMTVQITESFKARFSGKLEYQLGDTPGEAVMYLDFPEIQSLSMPEVTTADDINSQISEILTVLEGEVYIRDILDNINQDELNGTKPTLDELKEILKDMEEDNVVYRSRGNYDTWWNLR